MASESAPTGTQRRVAILKDLTAAFRDAFLLLFALLLLVFPVRFNDILTSAGFEEGSFAGMKWKANLEVSDQALKEARAKINDLEAQLNRTGETLAQVTPGVGDPELAQKAATVAIENDSLRDSTQKLEASISAVIERNAPLVYAANKSLGSTSNMGYGVVYGGDTTLDAAKYEIETIAKNLGLPDPEIYLRKGSYRSVSRVPSQDRANEVLEQAKKRRSDAYIIRFENWCPKQTEGPDFISCQS